VFLFDLSFGGERLKREIQQDVEIYPRKKKGASNRDPSGRFGGDKGPGGGETNGTKKSKTPAHSLQKNNVVSTPQMRGGLDALLVCTRKEMDRTKGSEI